MSENNADSWPAKWFSEFAPGGFAITGECFQGKPPAASLPELLQLLQIDADRMRPFARELVAHANDQPSVLGPLLDLVRGIRAYLQFQDIMSIVVDPATPLENRHYCYYESIVYLREAVVCWLDGNVLAALTILRPLLELSILHCYWKTRCEDSTYETYYAWLEGKGRKPGFAVGLAYVFERIPAMQRVGPVRSDKLQRGLTQAYAALCAYNHTPLLSESVAAASGAVDGISLEMFLYALHMLNALLRQLVYLYILVYPMSLFPVDGTTKFGFSGPVGLFFDRCNFALLEDFIGHRDTSRLAGLLRSLPEVMSLTKWFEDMRRLSTEEIEADWHKVERERELRLPEDAGASTAQAVMIQRLAADKAHYRALRWALNYVNPPSSGE